MKNFELFGPENKICRWKHKKNNPYRVLTFWNALFDELDLLLLGHLPKTHASLIPRGKTLRSKLDVVSELTELRKSTTKTTETKKAVTLRFLCFMAKLWLFSPEGSTISISYRGSVPLSMKTVFFSLLALTASFIRTGLMHLLIKPGY